MRLNGMRANDFARLQSLGLWCSNVFALDGITVAAIAAATPGGERETTRGDK
jgi:hypothetical protein